MVMLAPPTETLPEETSPVAAGLGSAPEESPATVPFPGQAEQPTAEESSNEPEATQEAPPETPEAETIPAEPEPTEISVASQTLASIKDKRDHVRSAMHYWESCKEETKDAKDRYEKLREELDAMIDHGIKETIAPAAKPEGVSDEDESTAESEVDWASTPTSELNLLSVKGMGQKKVDEIEHEYPTIGDLEELRARRGGLTSLSGIGERKASDIEQKILDWLSANRDAQVLAEAAAGGGSGEVEGESEEEAADDSEQESPNTDPPVEDSTPEQQIEDDHAASEELDDEQVEPVEEDEQVPEDEQASADPDPDKPTWHYAIEQCNEILDQIDDIPEAGEEFATSASQGVRSIGEWIEKHQHVTDKQLQALDNIQAGVANWIN